METSFFTFWASEDQNNGIVHSSYSFSRRCAFLNINLFHVVGRVWWFQLFSLCIHSVTLRFIFSEDIVLELNDNLYVLLQVIKTERAGHAREVMTRITEEELNALDGVVVVVRTFLPP